MESPESGTPIDTGTPAPEQGSASAEPAAPAAPAWSLDTWKDDQWDALPERIRKAAEGRYQPEIQKREQTLSTMRSEIAAAKKAAEDARAKWLSGSPFGAEDLKRAQAELAAIREEFEGYKAKYNDGVFNTSAQEWQTKWDEAVKRSNEQFAQRHQSELAVQFPWSVPGTKEAPNPEYDAAAMAEADRLVSFIDDGLGLTDVPDAAILTVAKMNPAQRGTFAEKLAESGDWRAALAAARQPPAYTPSPAARAHQASAPTPPARPGKSGPVDRSALRAAAEAAAGRQGLRPPTV